MVFCTKYYGQESFALSKSKTSVNLLLSQSVRSLKGIGGTRAVQLAGLGITTVEDAITYFPRDYEDRSNLKKLSQMADGDQCSFEGIIASAVKESRPRRGLLISRVAIRDETGSITAVWFNQGFIKNVFKQGERYLFFGKITKKRTFEVQNPVYERALEKEEADVAGSSASPAAPGKTCRIMPVYSSTAGMTQNILRSVIRTSLDIAVAGGGIEDIIPSRIREEYGLEGINFCLENIHFPASDDDFMRARQRLVFEELLLLQLKLYDIKNKLGGKPEGIRAGASQEVRGLIDGLPYGLTSAQKRVLTEIEKDMESSNVMNRLVQGDVGSGKTILAAASLFKAAKSGYQGAMMVPTGILARQHYETLCHLFAGLGVTVALVTGNMPQKKKTELLKQIGDGSIDIVIGTHALLEEKLIFDRLGLVVTDEQHRFGVRQRAALTTKGKTPDTLVMTATPIPRTLALILYGDLDISVLDEMPPGRKPVETFVVDESKRSRINNFIRKNVNEGHQAFIICPMVEESENITAKAAASIAERLSNQDFSDLSVGLLHGRMKAEEKDKVMEGFADGRISILVSTTVVEVGVNIPNANLMVVENAERFGLAQLHQLRGRVGRGGQRSYCILFNEGISDISAERMKVMEKTGDGFIIAEKDLELRGPGEFFGTRQHGLPELKIANLYRDIDILKKAQTAARQLLEMDRQLEDIDNRLIRERMEGNFNL